MRPALSPAAQRLSPRAWPHRGTYEDVPPSRNALAAFGAGAVRSLSGSYMMAFIASGLACLMASMLVLRVTPRGAVAVAE